MQDQLLVPLDGGLQILQLERFVRAVRHQDAPRPVEVPRVVAREVGHVRAVVDRDSLEALIFVSSLVESRKWKAERVEKGLYDLRKKTRTGHWVKV